MNQEKLKKALTLALFVGLVGFTLFPVPVFGNHQSSSNAGAGITPTSYFYFLDSFLEKLRMMTTFRPINKANVRANFVTERIKEWMRVFENRKVTSNELSILEKRINSGIFEVNELLDKTSRKDENVEEVAYALRNKITTAFQEAEQVLSEKVSHTEGRIKEKVKNIKKESEDGNYKKARVSIAKLRKAQSTRDLILEKKRVFFERVYTPLKELEDLMSLKLKAKSSFKRLKKKISRLRTRADIYEIEMPTGFFMTAGYRKSLQAASSSLSSGNFEKTVKATNKSFQNLLPLIELISRGEDKAILNHKVKWEIRSSEVTFKYLKNAFDNKNSKGMSINLTNKFRRTLSESKAEFRANNLLRAHQLALDSRKMLFDELNSKKIKKNLKKAMDSYIVYLNNEKNRFLMEVSWKDVSFSENFQSSFGSLFEKMKKFMNNLKLGLALGKLEEIESILHKEAKSINKKYLKTLK